jgi:hypothetical protein
MRVTARVSPKAEWKLGNGSVCAAAGAVSFSCYCLLPPVVASTRSGLWKVFRFSIDFLPNRANGSGDRGNTRFQPAAALEAWRGTPTGKRASCPIR